MSCDVTAAEADGHITRPGEVNMCPDRVPVSRRLLQED